MIRGAVYRIDLRLARGHEQRGKRLGLVLSEPGLSLSVATVVPTSTSARSGLFRVPAEVAGRRTVFLIDQIRSIDTDYILGDPVDYLDWGTLADVELAVAHYLGLAERLRTAGHLGDAPRPRQDPRRSQ